uniref:Uncharacterized protein n=1 Tax=Rhizophora mucronata TaxID=61149 RepID=A0A2P2MZG4_RHIMU
MPKNARMEVLFYSLRLFRRRAGVSSSQLFTFS